MNTGKRERRRWASAGLKGQLAGRIIPESGFKRTLCEFSVCTCMPGALETGLRNNPAAEARLLLSRLHTAPFFLLPHDIHYLSASISETMTERAS